jgi:predicted transcriptional regulator of viral defense system
MKTKDKVFVAVKKAGIMRAKDAKAKNLPPQYLSQLVNEGRLRRVGRGLYAAEGVDVSERQSLVEAAQLVPHGIVCLLTALQFHGLTTQAPFEIWMAIGEKKWRPQVDRPALRLVWFSGEALASGVETHKVQGVKVMVYSPAKTVADCFKYRNKIGLDVALEALRDCLRKKKCSMDDIWHFAKICRVSRVMKPYLEAIS